MKAFLLASLLAASWCSAARAANGPVPNPHLALGGPLVSKLDWGTHSLQAIDLNSDGLRDIVLVNDERSSVEILLQNRLGAAPTVLRSSSSSRWEPVLEDAPFRRVSVTVSTGVHDLVVGDLNGDRRPDLVYTGEVDPLTLRLQREDGTWSEQRIAEAPLPLAGVGAIRLGDIDGDGRLDFVMLGQKEVAVFRQKAEGGLGAPDRYPLAEEGCFGLELVDVDQDGRLDLLYLVHGSREPVRVRRQTAGHQFGAEMAYAIKPTRCTLQVLPLSGPTQTPTFGFAQDNTGHFEEFRLVDAREVTQSTLSLRPRLYTLRPGAKVPSAFVRTDVDGDGRADVLASDPEGAQIWWFRRQPEGGYTLPEAFPVMAEVRSLAALDWDGDGRSEVFMTSAKEQVLGVTRWSGGRLSYPQPLVTGGKPLAVAAAQVGDRPTLALLREEGGKRAVEWWVPEGSGARQVQRLELAGAKGDPRGIRWMDTNGDGRLDVLVFSPLEAMRILLQEEEGSFTDLSTLPGYRRGLVENLDASAVSSGDLDGDGRSELLVQSGAFVRALRVDDTRRLVVVDQVNARDSANEIGATLVLGTGARPSLALWEKKSEAFQFLRPQAGGLYQVTHTQPAGKIEVVATEVVTTADGAEEAYLFGRDRFWWLPLQAGDRQATTVATYATDLPEISYGDVIAGDLNADGVPEMVCIDPSKNFVEVLGRTPEGGWASRLHFKVFEVDQHFQGRKGGAFEPRETLVADVTGDGKNDLILLVHDRVLVYPQVQAAP